MESLAISKTEIVTMTSLEVVGLINNFRKEEGSETLKRHDDFIRSIRKEFETLIDLGIEADRNFTEGKYLDKNNQERPCYKMNKAGIMQMLNKESALVRYKTQQYIEGLENKLKRDPYENLSTEMKALLMHDEKIQEIGNKVEKVDKKFDDLPLFPTDSKILKKLVNQTVVPLLGGKKSQAYKELSRKVFSDLYKQIHREFGVSGCEEIKRKDLEIAKEVISNYKLPRALEIEINTINSQVAFA